MAQDKQSVLLGLLDEEISNGRTSFALNKIGGLPDWVKPCDLTSCGECSCRLVFICQIYCPLEHSDQHRTLYIFACVNRKCWNKQTSWKVLRCQIRDSSYKSHDQNDVGVAMEASSRDDWGTAADDWGDAKATDWGCDANNWGDGCHDDSERVLINEQPPESNSEHQLACGLNQHDQTHTETQESCKMCHNISDSLADENSECLAPESSNESGNGHHLTQSDQNVSTQSDQSQNSEHSHPGQRAHCEPSVILRHDNLELNNSTATSVKQVPVSTDTQIASGFECMNINDVISRESGDSDTMIDVDVLHNTDTSIVNYLKIDQAVTTQENIENINASFSNKQCEKMSIPSPTYLQAYYINVMDEPEDVTDSLKHEESLLREYARSSNMDFDASGFQERETKSSRAEGYEKSSVPHGDRIFHKFIKRIARCPQQILRYQYDGDALPLRLDQNDNVIPTCSLCGKPRVFELQLMPALVSLLKIPNTSESVVEFGTVMVYTCKASCWSSETTSVEEHIIVQPDPDQHLFKV